MYTLHLHYQILIMAEKTENIGITLTRSQKTKAKELSRIIFGRENISGYYAYLIEREHKKL